MKTVVYITKNKIWAGEQAFDWDGKSMDEVFGKIKKDLKISEIRIVLGNDISFVTAVKAGDAFLSRENVLKLVKSWMPFEIDSSCFDWKKNELARDDVWIQVIALEKHFLSILSSAIKKSGIRVDLVTSIGVLLGKKSEERETPIIIKWSDKETLLVLAIHGLVDLVVSDTNEDDLMVYANQRWGLAVNPEVLTLRTDEFNLSEIVFSEKTKGEDSVTLNLPLLKDVLVDEKPESEKVGKEAIPEIIERVDEEKKPGSKLWIYLVFLLVSAIIGAVVLYNAGYFNSILPVSQNTAKVTPTPSIAIEVTPIPTAIDLSGYKVQVLNGSGVTGEAAKIKTQLLSQGFVIVDTGNAIATTEGKISAKENIPESVVKIAGESMKDFKMGTPDVLTSEDNYDLILILGSAKAL